jgi:hypothetical protein
MAAKKKAVKRDVREKIVVENVNHPGQKRNVDKANYLAVKAVMLKVLPKTGGLTQSEMVEAVRSKLTGDLKAKAAWWAKSVQLDLEAKGVVVRDGGKPLRWRRA